MHLDAIETIELDAKILQWIQQSFLQLFMLFYHHLAWNLKNFLSPLDSLHFFNNH